MCIIIVSYDVLNNLKIRTSLVKLFCNDTSGDCHFEIENIYGLFHNIGSLISLFFNHSNFAFILGQIFTLLIYFFIIWILMKIVKNISRPN